MKNYIIVLTWLIFLLTSGCKQRDDHAHHSHSPDSHTFEKDDTRSLVRDAINRIDPMKIQLGLTEKRIKQFEGILAQEKDPLRRMNINMVYATDLLKLGKTKEAALIFEEAWSLVEAGKLPANDVSKRALLTSIAITYLRQGELENCLAFHNHESCFIPIQSGGIHKKAEGSRKAIYWYEKTLKLFPQDLESVYLLNIAYMTLGEYPDKVPQPYRIPKDWFENKIKFPRYKEIAADLGVNTFNLAGGSIIDDFTNDGWPDIIVSSMGLEESIVFYVNQGDGSFKDETKLYRLDGQVGVLQFTHTDINNDGLLDLLLLRGAWYHGQNGEIPKTLLLNTGKGFKDITIAAGITKSAPSQAAAWQDVNLDGWIDLLVANESLPGYEKGIDLYINQKNNTFKLASEQYGLTQNDFFKGCAFIDLNNDRYPDLYLSALDHSNYLLVQDPETGKFVDVTNKTQTGQPVKSFPCWAFDYNNDGKEDIFVSGYSNETAPASDWMNDHFGRTDPTMLPKLYRNEGNMKFTEVGKSSGLNEVAFTMGCNYGDINTDGYLDFYLATGNPGYQSVVPNKMYLNLEGKRFEDISYAGGFANIQKGHGVSFGDLDHDGDEDMYVSVGGAYEGDGFYNCLFENPNHENNNWLILKLIGTSSNKIALGARVKITCIENGNERLIYRTVSAGSSFGGNSFLLEIGLGKTTAIQSVEVTWPCQTCDAETYSNIQLNTAYTITQGEQMPRPIQYKPVVFKKENNNHSTHHH